MHARNPRTGENDYIFTPTPVADVKSAAKSLKNAQKEWAAKGIEYRCQVLGQFAAAVQKRTMELVTALSTDTGRLSGAHMEVAVLGRMIGGWCGGAKFMMPQGEYQDARTMPGLQHKGQAVPLGTVGVISPWNFPVLLSFIDTVPALLAGCAVLLKPSEVTPRFQEPLIAAIQDVPELAEVLRVVRGGAEVGKAVVDNADAVCFTGSVKTGKIVAMACASNFIPCFLELGGKDPAVVLASADLERATTAILRAGVAQTGQACQSVERVYVDQAVYEPFVKLLAEKASKVALNYPDINTGHIGPLIFEHQAATIEQHLADATAKGATCLTGGVIEKHGGGNWINATVLTGVNHEMDVMREETFGPVLPVMPFTTVAEAVELCNDSPFGLSAAVFAATIEEAETFACQINAGAVCLNDASLTAFCQEAENDPFGASGMGKSRMGKSALLRFFRTKAILANRGESVRSIDMSGEAGAAK